MVQTLGCQMNVHDSRRIREVLRDEGYESTDEAELADLIVVNTCSVREKAEHKLMSLLGRLRPLKEARRDVVLAVAGCVAQQEGARLLKKVPYLDLVLGPDNIPDLPALLADVDAGRRRSLTVFDLDSPRFLSAAPDPERPEVACFVTVMKGCDERCTYCIVPTTRGAERYRPADEIVAEVSSLARGGVREVTLLGQTVNSWYEPGVARPGLRAPSESAFADLLRRIAREVPELSRLRYTSPHPRHITPALVAAHAELELLPAHVHLPSQSGSDAVLKRMSRRYTQAEYLERAESLKSARPGFTLSTDLIVGFPGETEEDFLHTLDLVRNAGFVAAFCFKYSPRPGTPALSLGDDVPEGVKQERLARLFEVVAEQQRAHLRSLVDTEVEVLVTARGDDGRWQGRSQRHEKVHLELAPDVTPMGELLRARVAEAFDHSLLAVGRGGRLEPKRRRLPLAQEPST
ncbi:MAG: tRNA (N6-isopentenyl adenosine(37)-C2)-methylthiotransferase MiaB [Deltaproteobacteria bacterium]|nr:tRNA (N6-isopentenyl adenosine(37)-C2)-methylthiotransferase MiaB [Deltaproteobacteria bacterium]